MKTGLHAIENASRDEISALQVARLKQTLQHVYANVPYYREKFDAAGVHPDRAAPRRGKTREGLEPREARLRRPPGDQGERGPRTRRDPSPPDPHPLELAAEPGDDSGKAPVRKEDVRSEPQQVERRRGLPDGLDQPRERPLGGDLGEELGRPADPEGRMPCERLVAPEREAGNPLEPRRQRRGS